ncbi:hypothetical protein BDF20DRAFT_916094 [Mycotypha africana]|uniref:uncharacterized protein n=1 Tax=Mycotypha africana TaxID=64632 RepID=UPI002300414C|nr:uncharacterized protein BDF20DRAFT_916094 [Mycotypha africana]KAI8970266.1 hypothetical protein BDF20DRAFT_916094 [Mycotypha africana]
MSQLPDPIASASAYISAYMSGHANANLAYVKHFGKKLDAVSATFKSLNSQGFIVTYKNAEGKEDEVFIEYTSPVTKREDVRVVLEDMAKEAEKALGMPSSLDGPPPIQALMKAAAIENAQEAEIAKAKEDREAEASAAIASSAVGNLFENSVPKSTPLDVFYPADRHWQLIITAGMGATALLGYASDDVLRRLFPSFVLSFRNYMTPELIQSIFFWASVTHVTESFVALCICLKRRWYSPLNILKWTGSTMLYGFASMRKLIGHGQKASLAKKKIQ